jgi:hypothetical protein
MNRYEEICEASDNAVRRWSEYRERSWGYLMKIVQGLVTHCGVPPDKIAFLRSNDLPGEARRYSPPEDGGFYTLPGAATFEEDGYWHLGISVTLSPKGTFPARWIGAIVCVTENGGQADVKIGANGKSRTVNFSDAKQCAIFCDELAVFLKERFDNPQKITRQIGFSTVANPQQGEKQEKTAAA